MKLPNNADLDMESLEQNTDYFLENVLEYDPIVFSLESPKYHLLKFDSINRFSGYVFNFGKRKIASVSVYSESEFIGNFIVDIQRPDIARYVPGIQAAQTCGFSFHLPIDSKSDKLKFEIIYDDSSRELFFEFSVANVFTKREYFTRLQNNVTSIPRPDPNLVYLTQGHYNVEEYENSILPGIFNMGNYLERSGVDLSQIHSLLDFGCGPGRLLVGWCVAFPGMDLHGCDLNENFIFWAQRNLPEDIKCIRNNLSPPLPYEDSQFDFIYLISVFTHLSLNNQKLWIEEFKRILKIGGHLLITLHGELYVRNSFWRNAEKITEFIKCGYIEHGSKEGSNHYVTYHTQEFPNGRVNHKRRFFQIAASQDIYVLKYVSG
jgi:SAM-dependent methyltransferase